MRVEHLSLANFRNYATAELPLGVGPQLLVGRNGQGKTNLVEAVSYFDSLSSHRVSNDQPLIRAGSDSAVIRMKVAVRDREVTLELEFQRGKPKRAQINGNSAKPRELMQWFTCVVFAPEDLMIARGEPSNRRDFLDEAIVTRNPAMEGVYRDFERVLKQRNSLLKSVRQGASKSSIQATLPLWNDQLAGFGSRIIAERRSLISLLIPRVGQAYQHLVENDHRPNLHLEETILGGRDVPVDPIHARELTDVSRETSPAAAAESHQLHANVSRETLLQQFHHALTSVEDAELDRGVTLIGPHRDELHLELNDLPVKGYASHGEIWSFVLSLRLAFAGLLRHESFTGDPVVILDDVFAELDQRRRHQLMDAVGNYEQILVTAAVPEDIPHTVQWNVATIDQGEVVGHSQQHMTQHQNHEGNS
ncbi:MAG: DNA replication/repair protein RecF [Canibacter sp.]